MDREAVYKISYGLFVLTTKVGEKQNGCIVNTVSMLTDNPTRIVVFVNNGNYTCEMIKQSGVFNASILTESAPFDLFKQFGFSSGRDTDKFQNKAYPTAENGVYYIEEHTNAVLSAKVVDSYDYGTHTLFVAELTDAKKLSDEPSATYDYYHKNIKPQPNKTAETKKKKWVCKICGYEYEGDELPDDYICPICKHPKEDFELV